MKKDKKSIILTISSITIMYFLLFCAIKYISIINYSIDLLLISTIGIIFISLHFLFDIKKLYNFIYKYRYLIGMILLTFITIMGYNGSSVAFWNRIVQPNNKIDLILGFPRGIRSDEWMVGTTNAMSQIYTNFSSINTILMGRLSLVTLFPSLPAFNLSVLCNFFNLPYLILPFENAFAFVWYGKIFACFFIWFELFMIITKKNKLYSLLGTVLITFSSCFMWWSGLGAVIWGGLAILIFYHFINSDKSIKKLLLSIAFGLVGLNYIMMIYPAWQVPFGYVFLGFIIWILIENNLKLRWKDLFYLIPVFLIIIPVVYIVINSNLEIYNLMINTVYPGARKISGGYGYNLFYNYMGGLFYPIISYQNPSEMSNFFSFYPIPILLSIFYMIKNKKINKFLLIFTIISIFLSIWNYIKLPDFLAKILLLSFSMPDRTYIVVGFVCIILLIKLLSDYEKNNFNDKYLWVKVILSTVFTLITLLICNNCLNNYLNNKMLIISFIILLSLSLLLLINYKKTNKFFAIILIILSLYIGGTVNPINKGLDVITDKPISKKIQKIVKSNNEALWISAYSHFGIPNYIVANGAKTLNSVNYYPNFDLMYKLDKDKKHEDIYNRYAHIEFEFTTNETSFELIANDHIKIYLNINCLKDLNIKYIVSEKDICIYQTDEIKFNLLYNEDGIYIFEVEV